jgi:hypothetical protein
MTVTAPASAYAANETGAGPTAKPKPAPSNSVEAFAEFKIACDLWLPQLNERDQDQASTHANRMFEQLRNSRARRGNWHERSKRCFAAAMIGGPSRTSNLRPPLLTLMPLVVAPRAPKWRQWFGVDIKRK